MRLLVGRIAPRVEWRVVGRGGLGPGEELADRVGAVAPAGGGQFQGGPGSIWRDGLQPKPGTKDA